MVRKFLAVVALVAPGFLAAAPAWAADQPCLQTERIYSWQPVPGNRALIVTDIMRHKFKVNFNGICQDLQWHMGLGFKPFSGSRLSCLDRGDMVIARPSMGTIGQQCPVESVQAYTPAMEKADAMAAAAAKQR